MPVLVQRSVEQCTRTTRNRATVERASGVRGEREGLPALPATAQAMPISFPGSIITYVHILTSVPDSPAAHLPLLIGHTLRPQPSAPAPLLPSLVYPRGRDGGVCGAGQAARRPQGRRCPWRQRRRRGGLARE